MNKRGRSPLNQKRRPFRDRLDGIDYRATPNRLVRLIEVLGIGPLFFVWVKVKKGNAEFVQFGPRQGPYSRLTSLSK
jgi:hypothetical protein